MNDLSLFLFLCSYLGKEVGETVLFYGCRHRNEDFLYQEELEGFEQTGVLTQLSVAFSRDQEHKVRGLPLWLSHAQAITDFTVF